MPNNDICGIQEDDNGSLWLSTNLGLSKIILSEAKKQPIRRCLNYNSADGLQGMACKVINLLNGLRLKAVMDDYSSAGAMASMFSTQATLMKMKDHLEY